MTKLLVSLTVETPASVEEMRRAAAAIAQDHARLAVLALINLVAPCARPDLTGSTLRIESVHVEEPAPAEGGDRTCTSSA
jgi:hypothetical protein